jgi:uncharacterized membrane protein
LSKKNKPFYSLQVNSPDKSNHIPPGMSHQILAVETVAHSGPIPSPETIAGYEKVLAGAADRIIKMAEKEQGHRHQIQINHQSNQVRLTFVGQLLAFLMGFSGIAGGIYLVKNDKSITGFGVFFTSLAALIGLFFFNQSRSKQQTPAKK